MTPVATPSHLQPTHFKVLAKLANLHDYERSYSRVPNKQTVRLLENGKKSHLTHLFGTIHLLIFGKKSHLYVIPTNTFIIFFTFNVKSIEKDCFFQTAIRIWNGSQGKLYLYAWNHLLNRNYNQNSSRINDIGPRTGSVNSN